MHFCKCLYSLLKREQLKAPVCFCTQLLYWPVLPWLTYVKEVHPDLVGRNLLGHCGYSLLLHWNPTSRSFLRICSKAESPPREWTLRALTLKSFGQSCTLGRCFLLAGFCTITHCSENTGSWSHADLPTIDTFNGVTLDDHLISLPVSSGKSWRSVKLVGPRWRIQTFSILMFAWKLHFYYSCFPRNDMLTLFTLEKMSAKYPCFVSQSFLVKMVLNKKSGVFNVQPSHSKASPGGDCCPSVRTRNACVFSILSNKIKNVSTERSRYNKISSFPGFTTDVLTWKLPCSFLWEVGRTSLNPTSLGSSEAPVALPAAASAPPRHCSEGDNTWCQENRFDLVEPWQGPVKPWVWGMDLESCCLRRPNPLLFLLPRHFSIWNSTSSWGSDLWILCRLEKIEILGLLDGIR